MRIAGGEHADHGPGLVAQRQRLADIHIAELAARALADHDLAQAGGEPAPFDDLDLVMHGPRLWADTTELRVDVGAIGLRHQVDHLRQLRRQHWPALRITADAGQRGQRGYLLAGDHRVGLGLRTAAQHDGSGVIAGVVERGLEAFAHRQHRHQHADHAGDADHDHRGGAPALRQAGHTDAGGGQRQPSAAGQQQPQRHQYRHGQYADPRQTDPQHQADHQQQHGQRVAQPLLEFALEHALGTQRRQQADDDADHHDQAQPHQPGRRRHVRRQHAHALRADRGQHQCGQAHADQAAEADQQHRLHHHQGQHGAVPEAQRLQRGQFGHALAHRLRHGVAGQQQQGEEHRAHDRGDDHADVGELLDEGLLERRLGLGLGLVVGLTWFLM
ncbi:hypothetical protein G6F57_015482 [Rhizopus arrhizus]|nr:hypothetical protein G6F57_015482 [Rhizopus arrhizus]